MSRRRWAIAGALALPGVAACGARTGFLLEDAIGDASSADAAEDAAAPEDASLPPPDADTPDVTVDVEPTETGREATIDAPRDVVHEPPGCKTVGVVVGDITGATIAFAGGSALPAGRYVLTWVDGCMRYSQNQGWTVNAYASSNPYGFDLVDGSGHALLTPPGTSGFVVGQGAYPSFDTCVAGNRQLDHPTIFDFAGGSLAIHLADSPYTDNVGGPGGRDPTWRLDTGACAGD